MAYLLVAFLLVALLSIAAFYKGALFRIQLEPFAWPLVAIEVVLFAFIIKLVLDEEMLEAKDKSQTQ